MAIKITLKNSVVQDSVPTTSHLAAVGELALNANINSLGIYMRASDNSIVKMAGPGSVTTPAASTTVAGIAELATSGETTTGTDTARVCTPAGVKAVTDAERTTSNNTYLALAGGTLTGVLAATAGSNSAPAIHFGDSDSGIYGGTNTVSLTAGGTTRLTADTGVDITGTLAVTGSITATGNVEIAQKLVHAGDTDTFLELLTNTICLDTAGSERARIDSSGRLLVAHSSGTAPGAFSSKISIEDVDSAASFSVTRNSANNGGPVIILGKTRTATVGGTTIVQSGDGLGELRFYGADGTDRNSQSAQIKAEVDGTPGENDMPGRLVFGTTADGAASPTTRLTIDSAGLVNVPDNGKFTAGASDDLQLFHDGSNTHIENTTGVLNLRNSANIVLAKAHAETLAVFTPDGANELYYDNSKKFETTSDGATLTGRLSPAATDSYGLGQASLRWANLFLSGDLDMDDDDKIKLGTGDDLQIYHDGSHSVIKNTTGSLYAATGAFLVQNAAQTESQIISSENGAVELFYDDSKKFETTSTGTLTTGDAVIQDDVYLSNTSTISSRLVLSSSNTTSWTGGRDLVALDLIGNGADHRTGNLSIKIKKASGDSDPTEMMRIDGTYNKIRIPDSVQLELGDSGDLQIYHDGFASYIADVGTGHLILQSNGAGVYIRGVTGEDSVKAVSNGAVELYYDNAKQFETLSNGVRLKNGHLQLNEVDGMKALFGASDDLQIYHDGTDNIITTNNSTILKILCNGTEKAIEVNPNGNVELYYDNVLKISTESSGAKVVGNWTLQKQTGGDASGVSSENLLFNTQSGDLGKINCLSEGGGGPSGHGGAMRFYTKVNNGSLTERFRIESDGDLLATDTTIGSLSDSRLKKNVIDYTYDLTKFKGLKPKTFDWINPEEHVRDTAVRGFLAQEVQAVDDYYIKDTGVVNNKDKELITNGKVLTSKLGANDAMYVSVIQQLMAKIETLETKVAALEGA